MSSNLEECWKPLRWLLLAGGTLAAGCAGGEPVAFESQPLRERATLAQVCESQAGRLSSCVDVARADSRGGGLVALDGEGRGDLDWGDPRPPDIGDPEDLASYGVASPDGYGHYCSMRWPDGGWAAAWDTNGNDPCGWLEEQSDPGGTVERAGMFSSRGRNRAVMRCADGAVYLADGWGPAALAGPFDAAVETNRPGCILTVSPVALPIFTSPFTEGQVEGASHAGIVGHNGHDFAQQGLYTLSPSEFGLSGRAPLEMLNHEGQVPGNYVDDHLGKDYVADGWSAIYPAMRGRVLAARWYGAPPTCTSDQGEVWLEHVVLRNPIRYSERFVTAYAHVMPMSLSEGDVVDPGDQIGAVAPDEWVGCGSAPHLHFDAVRVTNTTWHRLAPVELYADYEEQWGPGTIGNNSNTFAWHFDPYGWNASVGFDPWAWRAVSPFGALSMNAWRPGEAPPAGGWAPTW